MTPMLLRAGHEVIGFDTELYRGSTFGPDGARDGVVSVATDIRDLEPADLDGCDAVIHLAALSNDPLGDLDPELTNQINFLASVRLAEIARQAGVSRFLFSSSCSNYGAGVDDILTEESEFNPVTPYGRSKVAAEHEIGRLATPEFSPVMFRSGTAYGMSPRIRFDVVLNNLSAWAHCTGSVLLKSDGSPWRPIVHVADMSRAFLAGLEADRDRIHGEAFNVGRTSENYQIRDLARIVGEVVEGSTVELSDTAGPDVRNYRVNCDKIADSLPFEPTWTARSGVIELVEAYRRIGLDVADFEGPRYRRVDHIRAQLANGTLASDLRPSPGRGRG
jgi:nucleoside-diphosphate-sugar epimerase